MGPSADSPPPPEDAPDDAPEKAPTTAGGCSRLGAPSSPPVTPISASRTASRASSSAPSFWTTSPRSAAAAAPMTAPTTAPAGPATTPMAAPATAPAMPASPSCSSRVFLSSSHRGLLSVRRYLLAFWTTISTRRLFARPSARRVVRDRARQPEALRGHAIGRDAVRDEVAAHGVRAPLREILVERRAALRVGVPLDDDLRVGVLLGERLRDVVQLGLRVRQEVATSPTRRGRSPRA